MGLRLCPSWECLPKAYGTSRFPGYGLRVRRRLNVGRQLPASACHDVLQPATLVRLFSTLFLHFTASTIRHYKLCPRPLRISDEVPAAQKLCDLHQSVCASHDGESSTASCKLAAVAPVIATQSEYLNQQHSAVSLANCMTMQHL
jgi:hypothetical protein